MTFHSFKWIKTVSCVCVCASLLFAKADITVGNPDLKLSIGSIGWVESGQMVSSFTQRGKLLEHSWINRTFLDLTIDAVYKERLKLAFGIEGQMWYNFALRSASAQDPFYVHKENSVFIITDANASYAFGDVSNPILSITAGLFPYKYNPYAKNLGEYLFRSGTYPAYLMTNFDRAYERLTGFKFSSDLLGGSLHQDLIFNIETKVPPFYDGTLSYLLGYNFKKMVDVGAGVSFARIVSIDEAETTPKEGEFKLNNQFIRAPGDTGYYTSRGSKLMGRLCIDPLAILNELGVSTGFFGSEDLKLYGEALILGPKSYPANDTLDLTGAKKSGYNFWGYDSLKNKIPVIFGFNWPTHPLLSYTIVPALLTYGLRDKGTIEASDIFNRAVLSAAGTGALSGIGLWLLENKFNVKTGLDVLTLELEYYGCPYPNSYENLLGAGVHQGYPVPDDDNNRPVNYAKDDNWKWSVYAKKTFFDGHLGCIVQIARDHSRNLSMINEAYNYEEALSKKDQYWWVAKIFAAF